uniref:Uncharacterized protein n=1 Tax=Myoviridae sp. cteBs22 TaxID=2826675 RepID=A0A8S5R0A3_9CAUD|nr:MAG TPA: hypothetical protein [Myoviridae sp. cteBs22]
MRCAALGNRRRQSQGLYSNPFFCCRRFFSVSFDTMSCTHWVPVAEKRVCSRKGFSPS